VSELGPLREFVVADGARGDGDFLLREGGATWSPALSAAPAARRPAERLQRYLAWKRPASTLAHMRALYLAALELECYATKRHWLDIVRDLGPLLDPAPLELDNNEACSLEQLFGGQGLRTNAQQAVALNCYKPLWARMLAANVLAEFRAAGKSVGLVDSAGPAAVRQLEALRAAGLRFAFTYLPFALGLDHLRLLALLRAHAPAQLHAALPDFAAPLLPVFDT
jgi:hypothetical protein